ncbi:NAD(P)-dependent oxidoreductase [Meridianimarinicoccus sp. MJW13]|uniref:NAD-dependent epimerase/dehydratase family protein n=1 Tax=Meridianimarinicoccus sp. MJW13 TaxID=2720031 RepID=UPI001865D9E4|nr:NAD-dependent epimerase/dehydratase family protein [Fluviibacterium sp. MJW13]
MTRPRVLVLGAGGRVGTLLRAAWDRRGAELVVQSRRNLGPGTLALAPEVAGAAALATALTAQRPDLVVCLWGAVPGAQEADFTRNTRLAELAFRASAQAGIARFVALSTGAVYGPKDSHAFCEDDTLAGTSPYARSKIAMERRLRDLATADAPALTTLRLANLFGADQLAVAMRNARTETPLKLDQFPDGTGPRRSYASGRLLAALFQALADADPTRLPPVLNVADSAAGVDMAAVLDAMQAAGHPVAWQWTPAPPTALHAHLLDTRTLFQTFPALQQVRCHDAGALVRQTPFAAETTR